jgi:hypothetical protein
LVGIPAATALTAAPLFPTAGACCFHRVALLLHPHIYQPQNTRFPTSNKKLDTGGDRFLPVQRKSNLNLARRALLSNRSSTTKKSRDNNSSSSTSKEIPVQNQFKCHMMNSLYEIPEIPMDKISDEGQIKSLLSLGAFATSYLKPTFSLDMLRSMKVGHQSLDGTSMPSTQKENMNNQ